MSEAGKRNPDCAIDAIGLKTAGTVRYNFGAAELYKEAIRRCEQIPWDAGELRKYSGQFDVPVFRARFLEFLSDVVGSQAVASQISEGAAA